MPIPGQTLANDDIVRITTYTYDTVAKQLGLNVSHWICKNKVGPSVTDKNVATVFDALTSTPYKNVLPDTITYYGVGVQIVRGVVPMPAQQFEIGNAGLGAVASTVMATQVAPFASFLTTVAGRRGRGRKFYMFMPTTFYDDGNKLTAPALALYDNISNLLSSNLTVVNGGDSIVLSPGITNVQVKLPDYPTPYMYFNVIETWDTSPYLATQRRRGAFGRVNTLPF